MDFNLTYEIPEYFQYCDEKNGFCIKTETVFYCIY